MYRSALPSQSTFLSSFPTLLPFFSYPRVRGERTSVPTYVVICQTIHSDGCNGKGRQESRVAEGVRKLESQNADQDCALTEPRTRRETCERSCPTLLPPPVLHYRARTRNQSRVRSRVANMAAVARMVDMWSSPSLFMKTSNAWCKCLLRRPGTTHHHTNHLRQRIDVLREYEQGRGEGRSPSYHCNRCCRPCTTTALILTTTVRIANTKITQQPRLQHRLKSPRAKTNAKSNPCYN